MIHSTAPRLFTETAGLSLPPQGGRAAEAATHLPSRSLGEVDSEPGCLPVGGGIPAFLERGRGKSLKGRLPEGHGLRGGDVGSTPTSAQPIRPEVEDATADLTST